MICTRDNQKTITGLALTLNETAEDFEFIFKSLRDVVRRVHNIEIAPTTFLADASDAITNGFASVFNLERRIMCHVHVERNLDKHMASFERSLRDSIKQDFKSLQLASTPEIFAKAISLFNEKYSNGSDALQNFLTYFNKQWVEKYPGWYEGYAPGLPSSNNALESTNRYIKEHSKFSKRHSLSQFLSVVERKIVWHWSKERDQRVHYCL